MLKMLHTSVFEVKRRELAVSSLLAEGDNYLYICANILITL
jgi:hypothetical protein